MSVKDAQGQTVAYKLFVRPDSPTAVVLPSGGVGEDEDLLTIGRKFNHMGANAFVIPHSAQYANTQLGPDSLVRIVRAAVELAASSGGKTLFVVASQRLASVALLAATRHFKIKAVVAVSPGEYFQPQGYMTEKLERLRIGTLLLYTPKEESLIGPMVVAVPNSLITHFRELEHIGYRDLIERGKASGRAWLAISLFYKKFLLDQAETNVTPEP